MAMCKECGEVFGVADMKEGICKFCAEGVVKETVNEVIDSVEDVLSEDESIKLDRLPLSDIFGNLIGVSGRVGRIAYLLYGVVIPTIIFGFGSWLTLIQKVDSALMIGLIISFYMSVVVTIKRARDRNENPLMVVILAMVPYIGILILLYLLLAPVKKPKK